MQGSIRRLLALLLLLALGSTGRASAHAHFSVAKQLRGIPALHLVVQPAQIDEGRDVHLHITVADAQGKLVAGSLLSLTGAGRPVLGTAPRGTTTLTVHAVALGTAVLHASHQGYAPMLLKVPVVLGPPASVAAFKNGVSLQAPHLKPRAGKIGDDLLEAYHALTAARQFASLNLRDGTLVDLNTNTDVLIKDPLHTTLNKGELFLEVVHGDAHPHQVQVGTAVAATKGTRLDVQYNPRSKAAVVTVVEGKVQVSNKGASVLVGAGQQSTIAVGKPPSPPTPVNLSSVLAWVKNLPNSTPSVVPPVLTLPRPPIAPFQSPPVGQSPTMTITSALESTSWSGVVLVQEGVSIPAGRTVGIQPGTVVEMDSNASLSIAGTLLARGTAAAPIIFTSAAAQPAPNDWDYIDFTGTSASGSVLDYVQVFYGGYNGTEGAEVSASNGANPTISNSILAQSGGLGIYADDGSRPTITGCIFAGNSSYAASLPINGAALISGSRPGTNQTNGLQVRGTSFSGSGTLARQDVPYVFDGNMQVAAGATLRIEAGTVIQMNDNASLTVSGTLLARGTPAAPIVFTSAAAQPAPNDWDYIDFSGTGANGSVLASVQVFYGGYNGSNGAEVSASDGASPTLQNSIIAQSGGDGLFLSDASRATVGNCVFANNGSYAVSAPADDSTLITGTAVAAAQLGIQVRGTTISHSGTWHQQDAPFVLDGDVHVSPAATLNVQPGTVVLMNDNASLSVSGTLLAQGTDGAPIIVSSAASQPSANDWDYIDFTGSGASGSVLDHVQVFYGGYNGSNGAEVSASNGASPTIRNSVFAQAGGVGLYLSDGSRAVISNCAFAGNGSFAISTSADNSTLIDGTGLAQGQDGIQIRAGTVAHSGRWHRQDAPLMPDGNVRVPPRVTLTIDPGAVVQMRDNASLSILGTLNARGTQDAPIVITSAAARPATNDWDYIDFSGTGANASMLDFVQISFGGYNGSQGAELSTSNGASPSITHCLIERSSGTGLYVAAGSKPIIAYCLFKGDGGPAISLPARDAAHVHDNIFAPGQQGPEIRG